MVSLTREQIASVAGIALAATFSFFPFAGLFERLGNRFALSNHVLSMILMLTITGFLALVAFGIQKRPLTFFGIRRIGWRDLGAMFLAIFYTVSVILLAKLLVEHFSTPEPGETGEAEHIPLALGLTMAAVAGITEEFIYRGFVIEELGELVGNRWLAGAFSVLAFGLSHHVNGYGWSIELLYPTLAGLVITVLYLWRRNLLVCTLMHFGVDALQYWRAS